VHRFERDGLAGLVERPRSGRPRRLTDAQLEEIAAALHCSPAEVGMSTRLWDGKTLSAFVEQRYGTKLSVRQSQRMFRELGFRLRKPRSVIARRDPEMQATYKKKLLSLATDDTVDLWACDEHFQQHGSRCRMWVPPETTDPVLLHHPTRRSVGYFGAVRLRDGKFSFRREDDRFNADSFYAFLKQLWRSSWQSGRWVVIIVDNASYHHSKLHRPWREDHAGRFKLDFLPPYSPELNPVERVWKLTRRSCIHNRYFPRLECVSAAVEQLFAGWSEGSDILRRLCAIT